MEKYHTNRHSVYLLTYHIVFVTKYRKPCLPDALGDIIKNETEYLVSRKGGEVLSAETDTDHIHILADLPPSISPMEMVRIIKTHTARIVHADPEWGPYVASFYHGDMKILWAPSYFVATTGTASLEKVKAYISSQRTEEHHRKYRRKRTGAAAGTKQKYT